MEIFIFTEHPEMGMNDTGNTKQAFSLREDAESRMQEVMQELDYTAEEVEEALEDGFFFKDGAYYEVCCVKLDEVL